MTETENRYKLYFEYRMYAYMGTVMIFTIDIRLRKNAMFWVQNAISNIRTTTSVHVANFSKIRRPVSIKIASIYTGIYGIKSRTLMKNKGERILATTFQ